MYYVQFHNFCTDVWDQNFIITTLSAFTDKPLNFDTLDLCNEFQMELKWPHTLEKPLSKYL